MAQSTLAVLSSPDFPQVLASAIDRAFDRILADREALDAARKELDINDGERLSTPQVRAYLQRAQEIAAVSRG